MLCNKCQIEKPLSEFHLRTDSKIKDKPIYRRMCKVCRNKYFKEYRHKNRDKLLKQKQIDYYKNRERYLKNSKQYRQDNKERLQKWHNEYERKQMKSNVQYRLAKNLRRRLNNALKGNQKVGSAVKDLGCSIEFLKEHLESHFQPGMTWDNWATDGWHIDHIKPLTAFDLTERKQLLEAVNYKNLQPLWWQDNLSKGNK